MQMRTPNPYSLGQKALPWLVRMELLWLVSEDANEEIAVLWLEGEILIRIDWNTIPETPF